MTHAFTRKDEDQFLRQRFRDLGLDIAEVDLEKGGPIVEALLRGLRLGAIEAGFLAAPPSIDPAAIGRVIAGLRGNEEARQACSLADMNNAADVLEMLLCLERMSSGWISYLAWKAAPVVENNAVWKEVIEAARSSIGHMEADALDFALKCRLSRSEIGVLLAELIYKSSNGLSKAQSIGIAASFANIEKESVAKAIRRSKNTPTRKAKSSK